MVDCRIKNENCDNVQWYKRVSCPKCPRFKIYSYCGQHIIPTSLRVEKNAYMHCFDCDLDGVTADFWAIYQDKEQT